MNPAPVTTSSGPAAYPPGFRARRGLNWGFLGLLYTSFYMCRYNLSLANKSMSQEYGYTRAEMGSIITTALFAYACGQIINGLLTDRLGGKRAMLIGAGGTVLMNLLLAPPRSPGCWASLLPSGVSTGICKPSEHREWSKSIPPGSPTGNAAGFPEFSGS